MAIEYKDLSLDGLRANRPDLFQSMTETVTGEVEASLTEADRQLMESARTGAKPPAAGGTPAPAPPQTVVGLSEADRQRLESLERDNATLRGERMVEGALRESALSEPGKALLRGQYNGALADATFAERVKASVEALAAHEKALMESVRLPGVPGIVTASGDEFKPYEEIGRTFGHPVEKKEGA